MYINHYAILEIQVAYSAVKIPLDYIHCASTASPNKKSIESLTELTLEFLNLYGCERAIKIT